MIRQFLRAFFLLSLFACSPTLFALGHAHHNTPGHVFRHLTKSELHAYDDDEVLDVALLDDRDFEERVTVNPDADTSLIPLPSFTPTQKDVSFMAKSVTYDVTLPITLWEKMTTSQ